MRRTLRRHISSPATRASSRWLSQAGTRPTPQLQQQRSTEGSRERASRMAPPPVLRISAKDSSPRGSIHTTNTMEFGPKKRFWVPNSMIVAYMDPLGVICTCPLTFRVHQGEASRMGPSSGPCPPKDNNDNTRSRPSCSVYGYRCGCFRVTVYRTLGFLSC